jgi:hypothetical protein
LLNRTLSPTQGQQNGSLGIFAAGTLLNQVIAIEFTFVLQCRRTIVKPEWINDFQKPKVSKRGFTECRARG